MTYAPKHDHDAFKELWLRFENEHRKFPLYPDQTVWIEYSYSVAADKWGKWFQRAVRLPTERLNVKLEFPAELEPAVWGLENSMTANSVPVRSPILQRDEDGCRVFEWSVDNPELHTRFRFEWRFGNDGQPDDPHIAPSERMRRLGVIQKGDPILETQTKPFDLPKDVDIAETVGQALVGYLGPLRAAHQFSKGIGLAAPQIGIARSAAVVQLPGEEQLVLYNPRIIESSEETDCQYEGCLSLFDLRGEVERPLRIEVEHTALDGQKKVATFERAAARLWAHEIDHLDGILYPQRMSPDAEPIPVERYTATGETWHY